MSRLDAAQAVSIFATRMKARKAALVFILITVTLDMIALGIIIPVLPKLILNFLGGSAPRAAEWLGIFGTVFALMQFFFSPLLGVISDRVGRRPVILLSNLGLGLDYLVMALAPTLGWLFIGRIISGITAASISKDPELFEKAVRKLRGRVMPPPGNKQPDGKAIDAATGAPVDSIPDSASAVRLNNRLRRTVDSALGGLTLLSPDAAARISAAQSVFRSHEDTLLPVIEGALAKETNRTAKAAFQQARAAILLFKSDASEADKLEAVATIKDRGDQEALAIFSDIGADQPPAVAAASDALLPAYSQILTPHTELSNMFLIEPERGCHRGCTYCVMRRSTNGGMRLVDPARVKALIP